MKGTYESSDFSEELFSNEPAERSINAFTPGPGNILALNTVTNYGYKKGRPLIWGIFAGYYVVQIICAVFVFGVSTFLPNMLGIMKYIGAA